MVYTTLFYTFKEKGVPYLFCGDPKKTPLFVDVTTTSNRPHWSTRLAGQAQIGHHAQANHHVQLLEPGPGGFSEPRT